MSKRQWLMIFGVLVAVVPFLGVPTSLVRIIVPVIGLLIVFVAYRLAPAIKPIEKDSLPFSESKPVVSATATPPEVKTEHKE